MGNVGGRVMGVVGPPRQSVLFWETCLTHLLFTPPDQQLLKPDPLPFWILFPHSILLLQSPLLVACPLGGSLGPTPFHSAWGEEGKPATLYNRKNLRLIILEYSVKWVLADGCR